VFYPSEALTHIESRKKIDAQNALIPAGISDACSAYLNNLNSDPTLATCTTPIASALASFSPSSKSNKSNTTTITSALNTLCSDAISSDCPVETIRSELSNFYTACGPELTSGHNTQVITIYDVLYSYVPLRQAVCSKDSSGTYCVLSEGQSSGNSATKREAGLFGDLMYNLPVKRAASKNQVVFLPNATSLAQKNIPFLSISPNSPASSLCVPCTNEVLTAYINFQGSVPYAPGLAQTVLLTGLSALYQAVTSKCGQSFLGGAVQAASGIGSNGPLGAAKSGTIRLDFGLAEILATLFALGFAWSL
jgi:hypothetical protein